MSNPYDPLSGRRTCPYCNTEIIEGSKFCIGCGKPIDQPDFTPHNPVVNHLCPHCGRALRGNEIFCNYCGNKISQDSQQKVVSNKICPKCGHQLLPNTNNCPYCGYFIDENNQRNKNQYKSQNNRADYYSNPRRSQRQKAPRSNNISRKVITVAGIFALIVVLLLVFSAGTSESSTATETPPVQSTPI